MIKKIDINSLGIYIDLSINIHELEVEWMKQSSVYMEYMEKAIEAEDDKKNHQIEIDQIEASLDISYRDEYQRRGEKYTEKVIENNVKTHVNSVSARREQNILIYNQNVFNACVKAMEMKKAVLENLVKLYLGGYYSEPILEKKGEEISEKLRSRLNKDVKKLAKDI